MRLFVAVYPPAESAAALIAALPTWCSEHRIAPAHQAHMTLFFIGDTHPRELDDVCESVARSAGGLRAFDLSPTRLISLPERGEPRLVAAATDAPASLMELQRRLVQRLVRRPGTSKDNRFTPHLTLCRMRDGAVAPRVDEAFLVPAFRVSEVVLVKSILLQAGPVHEAVLRVGLE